MHVGIKHKPIRLPNFLPTRLPNFYQTCCPRLCPKLTHAWRRPHPHLRRHQRQRRSPLATRLQHCSASCAPHAAPSRAALPAGQTRSAVHPPRLPSHAALSSAAGGRPAAPSPPPGGQQTPPARRPAQCAQRTPSACGLFVQAACVLYYELVLYYDCLFRHLVSSKLFDLSAANCLTCQQQMCCMSSAPAQGLHPHSHARPLPLPARPHASVPACLLTPTPSTRLHTQFHTFPHTAAAAPPPPSAAALPSPPGLGPLHRALRPTPLP